MKRFLLLSACIFLFFSISFAGNFDDIQCYTFGSSLKKVNDCLTKIGMKTQFNEQFIIYNSKVNNINLSTAMQFNNDKLVNIISAPIIDKTTSLGVIFKDLGISLKDRFGIPYDADQHLMAYAYKYNNIKIRLLATPESKPAISIIYTTLQ